MDKNLVAFLNTPIKDLARIPHKVGDLFGVEIECEGVNVSFDGDPDNILKGGWVPVRDGSLRDHHGEACEWIFKSPAKYPKAVDKVNKLFDYFNHRAAEIICSNRTSVHVHYNMSDKNAYQVVNTFLLFTVLEDLLDRYCGEDRNGNLFCLSSRHAEQQVKTFEASCFQWYNFADFKNDLRYCSLNLAALNKFGTVEFRGMRGLDNKEDLIQWLSIINEFCEFTCYKMRSPVSIIENISRKTPLGFLEDIFSGENVKALTAGLTEGEVANSLYEGMRLIQIICYKIGEEFENVRINGKDFWEGFNRDAEFLQEAVEEPWPHEPQPIQPLLNDVRRVRVQEAEVMWRLPRDDF